MTNLSGAMIFFNFKVTPTTTSLLLSITSELFELDRRGGAQIGAVFTQITDLIKYQMF